MKRLYLWRVMRLILLFMIAGLLHVSAATTAQTITLKGTNLSFRDVITAIQQQTDFEVYAFERLLKDTKPVTVDVRELPLTAFLAAILEGQPLEAKVEDKTIVLSRKSSAIIAGRSAAAASEATNLVHAFPEVRGRVVDSLGNPLQGASVRVLNAEGKRTTLQTTTDQDGYFELKNVPEGYQLELSYIGHVATTVMSAADVGTVLLNAIPSELEEVEVMVNTGYQQLPKERATGSFELVDEKLFNRQIGTDVISRLDGIMPSILFDKRSGGEKNMLVRGVTTLGLTTTEPLIILDNFPFEGDINTINPNDVESVTLLKDAAAASIWGAKAGNGVLVITTKKGRYKSPWRLSLTANTTMTEKPDLYYTPQMTSSEFIEVEKFLYGNGAYNSALNNTTSRPPVTPVVELLHQHKNGLITDEDLEVKLDEYGRTDLRDDLTNYFYRTGINQQYALNLSGGGEKHTLLFSLGYDRNTSTSVGNDFSRLNLNLQNAFRPISNLEVNIGMRYAVTDQSRNHPQSMQMVVGRDYYPYARFVDENGNALTVEKDYRGSYVDEVAERRHLLDWRYRPYEELYLADNTSQSTNMLLNTRVKYDFSRHFSGELNYQYEYQPSSSREHYSEQTYYTRNLINRFTQVNGDEVVRPIPLGGILDAHNSDLKAHAVRGQLNFQNSWGVHHLSAIAGGELRHAGSSSSARRLYGYDDDLLTQGIVNLVDRFPIYDDLSFASTIVPGNSSFGTVQRFVSVYGNAAYTFDNRYTFSASARRDASNLFGVATNNKWKPLWSVGGIWNIHNEAFYNFRALPVLKLRATYGFSGNVSNSIAAVTTVEYRGNSRIGRFPYAIVRNPPNPELRWEKVRMANIGAEAGFKNGGSLSIEYYRKLSTDLIDIMDADPTTGFNFFTRNNAKLANDGWDITLNSPNVKLGVFSWLGNLAFSINKNRVLKYLYETSILSSRVGDGILILPTEGVPTYSVVSFRWGGLDPQTGDPIAYLNGEKTTDYTAQYQQATWDDLVVHGSALPEYYGAFRNTLNWKDLSLSFNITFRAAYYFRRETINYNTLLSGNTRGHADYAKRWQYPGDERYTSVPSLVYPDDFRRSDFYQYSEVTAERGDHIRLQDLNLSYTFNGVNKRLPFRQVRATFYARNLGIIWRANEFDLDPDVRGLPLARSFSFGITADF